MPPRDTESGRLATWVSRRMNLLMAALRSGNAAEAYRLVEEIIKRVPGTIAAIRIAADLAVRQKDWQRAVRYQSFLLAETPQDDRSRLTLAQSLFKAGAVRAALDMIDRLIEATPTSASLPRQKLEMLIEADLDAEVDDFCKSIDWAGSGAAERTQTDIIQTLIQVRQFSKAERWLTEMACAGESVAVVRLRATLAYRKGEFAIADALWMHYGEMGDDANRQLSRIFRARIAVADNRTSDATSLYAEIFDRDPTHEEAARHLVRHYIVLGEIEQSAAALDRFSGAVERNAVVVWLRASLLAAQDQTPAAIAELESGLQAFTDNIDLYCRYADLLSDQGDNTGAARILDRAALISSGSVAILNRQLRIGQALQWAPETMLAVADEILRQNPNDETALLRRGNLLIRLSRREEAVATFVRGIDTNPRQTAFWTSAINNLLILNRDSTVAGLVVRARGLFTADTTTDIVILADILEAAEDIEGALQLVEQALKTAPDAAAPHAIAARLHEARGHFRKAWSHLLALQAQDNGRARSALQFARIAKALRYADIHNRGGADETFPEVMFDLIARSAQRFPLNQCNPEVMHVTGSLAAGGAERQVAMTVQALAQSTGTGFTPHLVGNDFNARLGRDFFLKMVQSPNARISTLSELRTNGIVRKLLAERNDLRDKIGVLMTLPPDLANFALPLFCLIIKHRPLVVHLWQDFVAIAGGIAAMLAGVPAIVLGTRSTRPVERQRARRYLSAGFHALMQYPGTVIVNNSRNGARDYETWLGLSPDTVQTIYNGYDFEALRGHADLVLRDRIRAETNAGPNDVVLGGVMRCSFEKRPELWTATIIELARRHDNVRGLLVGDGPMRGGLEEQVKSLGLSKRIRFAGRQSPVEPWMQAMDVLFLSSLTEGLPNVLIEAQALSLPVATLKVGGAPETVLDGKTGLVIDEASPQAIADAIGPLLLDPERRCKFGAEGRRWVDGNFSIAATVAKLTVLYNDKAAQQ